MDYIAIDIGASSGRLIHANFNGLGGFKLEELHRFKNGFQDQAGTDRWNLTNLVTEILKGLEKVKKAGINECFVGIDTWGVDYGLVDAKGNILGDPVSYRDDRTKNVIVDFDKEMPLSELYKKTGIQLQPFNTVFQLFVEEQEKLADAAQLMLMPDFLGYIFTGKAVTEKTNASTMQLLNLKTREWDKNILNVVGIENTLFPPIAEPGQILGELQADKFTEYELPTATFITIASHDTASAVVGTPARGDEWAYISSGTWSLMGVEIPEGISTEKAFASNFTNEWGVQGTIRFLKNIMGMWLIQEVARMQDYRYSFPELAELAAKEKPFQQFVNVNDSRFLNPDNMIEELQAYCRETEQKIPVTPGELARCIYDNLALCYAVELENLAEISGRKISKLHIVGGGSNNKFLNQLTADACNIEVEAGPGEATAIGNLMVQMIATNGYGTLEQAREDIRNSVELEMYYPHHSADISAAIYKREILKCQM
ncbi:rhamnulokinase [Enterococcus sp. 12F9_DIV0723]|uniref:rhamnulokinase n=1 Tax=Enterococcus sp. 12F9_DIV0723 TaxID=1834169 RepID=UPI000B3E7390|nr:rhamnulokinase [Enterococcus sp. 12F9_DIV0723]OUZ16490.1 rhamnulokinase [Enterococcus sp. 12F9_DIV0723]